MNKQKKKYNSLNKQYKCVECGTIEEIMHINPIVEPFLCDDCWELKNPTKE